MLLNFFRIKSIKFDDTGGDFIFAITLRLINDAKVHQKKDNLTEMWVANWVTGFFYGQFLLLFCLEYMECYRNFVQAGWLAAVVAAVRQVHGGKV